MKNTRSKKTGAVAALTFSMIFSCLFFMSCIFLYSCKSSNRNKDWDIEKDGGVRIVMQVQIEGNQVSEFIAAIRSRIERFGVTYANIKELDSLGKIQIEMPKVHDLERVEKILQRTGKLEFWPTFECSEVSGYLHSADKILQDLLLSRGEQKEKPLLKLLHLESPFGGACIGCVNPADTALVNKYLNMPQVKAALPDNLVPMWSLSSVDCNQQTIELVAIKGSDDGKAPLDGSFIAEANGYKNRNYGYVGVVIKMNSDGAKIWKQMTEENLNRCIAITVDGKVYSYPKVLDVIEGGKTQITGNFSIEEATDLATVLMGGPLPAPATILEEEEF